MALLTDAYLGPLRTSMTELSYENNPSHATGLFPYPLETENLMFSGGIERASGMKWING